MSNNRSQCPHCGAFVAWPDGTFAGTFNGLKRIIEEAPDPLAKASELLDEAQREADAAGSRSHRVLATLLILKIIVSLLRAEPDRPVNITVNFMNQYNQSIEVPHNSGG